MLTIIVNNKKCTDPIHVTTGNCSGQLMSSDGLEFVGIF